MKRARMCLLCAASLVLPLIAKQGENLAGVYAVLLAAPWSALWVWVMDRFGIDSTILSYLFLAAGMAVNATILYVVISAIAGRRFSSTKG
jgi:hypothetical protein